MISLILTIIAGIYIVMNGMNKGVLQVKIQILEQTGYVSELERKVNTMNFFLRWIIYILVLIFIGWIQALILFIINLIAFRIGFKTILNKYFDKETGEPRIDVFLNEIVPYYKQKQ